MADATVTAGLTGVTVTLTANTVSTVVYTTDGTTPTNPAVGTARNGHYIPASPAVATQTTVSSSDNDMVKLLSAGTPLTVERA